MSSPITAFAAYRSARPNLAEPIRSAADELRTSGFADLLRWEDLQSGGKILINEICAAIGERDLFIADLTGINPNVMFELGYAVACRKPIWTVMDESYTALKRQFDQLRILTTVGYRPCTNSQDLLRHFYHDRPGPQSGETIFETVIEPNLHLASKTSLLYLKNLHENEASIRLTRRISHSSFKRIVDDPSESTAQDIGWYANQVYKSRGVVCHLVDPDREDSALQTARYSFVAGMAHGFGKPILMLAENFELGPLDYRQILRPYTKAEQALGFLEEWLAALEEGASNELSSEHIVAPLNLKIDLKGLQFGEPIAENEVDGLADYFVRTASFDRALTAGTSIFIGRKGTGKTASFLELERELSGDKRNLICLVKPVAYEFQGVVELLRRYRRQDEKGYVVEALWKFLLLTEIAISVSRRIESKAEFGKDDLERKLVSILQSDRDLFAEEFSVRLERGVRRLLGHERTDEGDRSTERESISEQLHRGFLSDIRTLLQDVLKSYERVVILVDNLDKAWDRGVNLPVAADVLLSLLSVAPRLANEFDRKGAICRVSTIVFLRSDIFHKIKPFAREPDKINPHIIKWEDPEMFARLLEQRFCSAAGDNVEPRLLWTKYFCPTVREASTREYISATILSRPRDLIFFVNSAVSSAINKGHSRVDERDFLDAEKSYSLHALESVLVEGNDENLDLEAIVFGFSGLSPVLSREEIHKVLAEAGVQPIHYEDAIDTLTSVSFLGLQVSEGEFAFSSDPTEGRVNVVRSRRLRTSGDLSQRYKVHPAFRAFLEIR